MGQFELDFLDSALARRLLTDPRCNPGRPLESLAWLRKQVAPDQARAILTQVRLRAKALEKYPAELVRQWLFDDLALQQASGWSLAGYKAERFARLVLAGPVADLACGFGGDALGLAQAGVQVCAVDQDARRLALLMHNAGAIGLSVHLRTLRQTITTDFPIQDYSAWHIDPDRRPSAKTGSERRVYDLEQAEPGRAVIEALLGRNPHAAVKASPGLDVSTLAWPAEAEWISEHGELKQLVLWLGNLRDQPGAQRRATGLKRGSEPMDDTQASSPSIISEVGLGAPDSLFVRTSTHMVLWSVAATPHDDLAWPAPASQLGPCLYEPDAALIRANLVGLMARRHHLTPLHPRICYLTGPAVVEPSLTRFELLEQVPAETKNLVRHLQERRWRCVEVLCRGVDVDTTRIQVDLNRRTDPRYRPVSVIFSRLAMESNRVVAIAGMRYQSGLASQIQHE